MISVDSFIALVLVIFFVAIGVDALSPSRGLKITYGLAAILLGLIAVLGLVGFGHGLING